jgi:RNA polymerase sigma-70 factor (sigma-E family)
MAEAREDEFSRYVREARPALRRTAFLLTSDWYEADDLVQRTLITLHRKWESLEQRDHIGGYARTVMLRLLLADRRTHRWSREVLYDLPPEPDPTPDPYTLLADRMMLVDALAGLGPRQRAAVVLRYWEDRSVEETASAMGSVTSTVRSQTVRALATLRTALRTEPKNGAIAKNDPAIEGVAIKGRAINGKAEDAADPAVPGPLSGSESI